MSTLQGKIAIVTGSSRGIGAAIARKLAAEGAAVVVNYAGNRKAADEVVVAISGGGGRAIAVQADAGDPAQIRALFDAAEKAFGKVDILVNNAGTLVNKTVAETEEAEFDALFRLNVKGVYFAMKEAAARLADGGRVINLSSGTSRMMLPTYGAYSATKAAVEQISRTFAVEVGARGITVNSVLPGPTNTELFHEGKSAETVARMAARSPFNRLGEPDDIARVVAFLAGPEAGWITAQSIGANGGTA